MSICSICNSSKVRKRISLEPYIDMELKYNIYDCLNCHTRFAQSNNMDNHKEILHSTTMENSYQGHYRKAEKTKELLSIDLKKCRDKLIKESNTFYDTLHYIEGKKNVDLSILELGCATGSNIAYLQKMGYINSHGLDISSEPIEYAKETFGDYYSMNIEEDKQYDVIFFQGVIGCVTDPIDFLKIYLNHLSPNGVMFFNAPDVESVEETNEVWVSSPPPDVIYLFHKHTFSSVLGNEYEVVSYKTFTPLKIFFIYLVILRKRKKNIYPTYFYANKLKKPKKRQLFIKSIIKNIIEFLIKFLVKLKIIKPYSNEYGLIYKIQKKDNMNG